MGIISMSSFLSRNKTRVSQICEGDKYPTIVGVFTTISMCISSVWATRCIDSNLNEQVIDVRSILVLANYNTAYTTNDKITPDTLEAVGVNELFVEVTVDSSFRSPITSVCVFLC
jgi:hypothetical protein